MGISPGLYPKYAAIGSGTAGALKKNGIKPSFIGSGQPEETADAFIQLAKGERVLFPRAKQSRQSIQRLLKDKLQMLDVIVYQNIIREGLSISRTDYVVLTSPLNVQAYFASAQLSLPSRIVAIGATTAQALQDLGARGFRIAEQASEESLAKTILAWEK